MCFSPSQISQRRHLESEHVPIEDKKFVIKSFLYGTEMVAKRQRTNIPNAEVLELVLQDNGEELSDLEYGDLSEDDEALISKGVDRDLDLAEQR